MLPQTTVNFIGKFEIFFASVNIIFFCGESKVDMNLHQSSWNNQFRNISFKNFLVLSSRQKKHLFFVAVEIPLMPKIATIITGSSREISSTPSSELRKRGLEVVIGKNEALFADIIVKMWAKVPKPALHSCYDFIYKKFLQ